MQKVGGHKHDLWLRAQVCQLCYLELIAWLTRLNPINIPQLPCGHEYCRVCLEELRQKGVDKSCPLCRKPLPPGPEKLFDLGYGIYIKIARGIDRSRPGVAIRTPWPPLSTERQDEMDQAVAMLREAADQGYMMAQATCGSLYDFGWGVAKDDRFAFVYYEKAAQQGHALSQLNTGVCYRAGKGCEQSYERAAEWHEKAARQGNANAMYGLGWLHQDGLGRTQSFERAAEWFEQAVRQGHAGAQVSLGALLFNGQGVPENLPRALELYKQSAAQGNIIALRSLGLCHEFGDGVTQNYQEARRFYALASADVVDELNRLEENVRTECPFLGKQVVITGASHEDRNSRTGTATGFDHSRGRYVVELDGGGEIRKHLTSENLTLHTKSKKGAM